MSICKAMLAQRRRNMCPSPCVSKGGLTASATTMISKTAAAISHGPPFILAHFRTIHPPVQGAYIAGTRGVKKTIATNVVHSVRITNQRPA